MLENTEYNQKWTIQRNWQHRVQNKQKRNTICVGHHLTQTKTNNVNKTCALLQTTGGKDKPVPNGNRNRHHNTEPRSQRHTTGQHRKNKKEQHVPHQKMVVNSGVGQG